MAKAKEQIPMREKIFLYTGLFALALFLAGIFLGEGIFAQLDNWLHTIGLETTTELSVPFFGFSLSAWVFLFGLFFVKKNGRVWALLIILLLPHLAFLFMGYALGDSPAQVLDKLLFVLRFGGVLI